MEICEIVVQVGDNRDGRDDAECASRAAGIDLMTLVRLAAGAVTLTAGGALSDSVTRRLLVNFCKTSPFW